MIVHSFYVAKHTHNEISTYKKGTGKVGILSTNSTCLTSRRFFASIKKNKRLQIKVSAF